MSHILAGTLDALPEHIRHRLGVFRHKVFIERLHWEIPNVPPGATTEWDAFDAGNTIHLVALDANLEVCGCARLMPTTGAYLLKEVFPSLAGCTPLPASTAIWEVSRFGSAVPLDHRLADVSGMPLLPYALALASSLGATCVVGVITRSVARLYRRFGLELQDLTSSARRPPAALLACRIELDAATFLKVRCDRARLLASVIWFERRACLL